MSDQSNHPNDNGSVVKVTSIASLRLTQAGRHVLMPPLSTVALPHAEADHLLRKGFVEPADAKSALTPLDGDINAPQATAVASHISDDDVMDAIIDGITDLDDDAFGSDGKPKVKALEALLEMTIGASLRDKAWQRFQALQSTQDSDNDV